MEYITNDVEKENITDELNPYPFLGIDPTTPINECKKAFKQFITSQRYDYKNNCCFGL